MPSLAAMHGPFEAAPSPSGVRPVMLDAIAVLLVCQLIGEGAARGLGLPIPGPVLGLVLLFAALFLFDRLGEPEVEGRFAPNRIGRVTDGILGALGLLFVPAGVGVIQSLDVFATQGIALAAALIGSTVLTLLATVGTYLLVLRLMHRRGEREPRP